jgi:ABC-type multidrug transport system permease subunit
MKKLHFKAPGSKYLITILALNLIAILDTVSSLYTSMLFHRNTKPAFAFLPVNCIN